MEKTGPTRQGTPDSVHYASLGERLRAFLYDYVIVFAYIVALAGVNYGLILWRGMLDQLSPSFGSPWVKDGIALLTLILPVTLYFTLLEGSSRQATWGKRRVGLIVVDADGKGLSKTRAFIRNLVKFLPWQIAHTSIYHAMAAAPGSDPTPLNTAGFMLTYLLVGIYTASVLISKKNRAPYDWAAGAYVIRVETRAHILRVPPPYAKREGRSTSGPPSAHPCRH